MSFSSRHNLRPTPPPRNKYEQAPDDLRLVLRDALVEDRGWLGAYRALCDATHQLPNSGIWGDSFAREPALEMLEDLEWFEVFDLLEEYGDTEAVNASFERTGLAYEMTSSRRGQQIEVFDPEGEELEVDDIPEIAASVLEGRFSEPGKQWKRALRALRARPAEHTQAIHEAMGALEGVLRILTGNGKSTLKEAAKAYFKDRDDWVQAMSNAFGAMYGYSSQVPGARHGQWKDPGTQLAEATFVVRFCGSAIAFLLTEERMDP
ncbi:hypothetical protein ACTXJK_15190 [Brachybacterium tyrofermentans]|uniref:hypothetical protein n=1 Tax=Brachybacterium tyrofermentans TaxID=47848 RepID=UPI003FD0B02E